MRPASGLINQRIEIYADQDIPDDSGGMIPDTAAYWITSAYVRPINARRDLSQAQELLKPAFTFEISDRTDKTIKPNMLLKYRGGWFTITSCVPDYVYNQKLVITAISSDQLRRTTTNPVEMVAYWWTSNVMLVLNDASIVQQNPFNFINGQEINIPWSTLGNYRFVNVAYPISQPTKTHYQNADYPDDNSTIGGTEGLLGSAIETTLFKQHNSNYNVIIESNFILTTE